jgi:hypothetical protein
MYKLILIFLAWLLVFPGVIYAQDGDELQCSDADILAALDLALAQLQEAKSQEASAALASIAEVREMLAELDAQCFGLTFSGTASTVHGPVYVPEGIYRISVTAQKFFIMRHTVLDGDCGDPFSIFNEMGDGEFTAQVVFESEGCSALFETSDIFGPYTVTFEKIR